MKKSSTLKGAAVLLLVGLVSFMAWDNTQKPLSTNTSPERLLPYQTSATRSANIGKYCVNGVDRTSLVTTTDISTAKTNRKAVDSSLSIDGNSLIYKAVNGDTGGALSMVTGSAVNIGIFVGVFLVPFVIFLWIWPFLCCCCCCPSCCPSKCCQHAEDQPYTKCELLWPTVTLILALLVVISTAIYGFVNASNVGTSFNNMGCSLAMFTDDLLNGNTTTDGTSFFTGLNVFKSNLTDLSTQLNALQTALGDLNKTGIGNSYGNMTIIDTVQTTYTQNLPSGSATPMVLTYTSPINAAVGTVTSSFPAILGTSTTSNTLVYNLYNSILYARTLISSIKIYANNFVTNKGAISGQITPTQNTITGLITDVNSMDSKFADYLSYLKTPGTYGNLGMQGFYGFFIAFSFFSLLGVLLMACCDKPGCRHLMYFTCIFMFLGALVAFLISIIFSLIVPLFTWTCSYIDVSLANSSGFTTNFGAFLSSSTLTTISQCMPFGTGDIVTQVAGSAGAANGINNLTAVISKLNAFNNTEVQGYITGNLTAFTNTANYYAKGDITDLDSSNAAILNGLSDPSNSSNNGGTCNAAFSSDSWVPSVSQNSSYSTAVSCKVSSGHSALKADCNPLSGANCYGCIDSSQVLTLYTSAVTLQNDLNLKYSAACVFNTQLKNVWTNYYSSRIATIGVPMAFATTTSGGLTQRIVIATNSITNTANAASVFTALNNFNADLTSIKTTLNGIQTLTDPKYGMLSGLNCKLFGEDFVNFQNTICGSFYNNMYIIRLTFGICAWGVLFVLCCSVCSGVRHFKQVEKLKRVSDGAMRNDFDLSKQNLNRSKQ